MSFQPLGNIEIDPYNTPSLTGIDAQTGVFLDADQTNSSVLIKTGDTPAMYIDKFQNMGINTTSPGAQLDVNSANSSHVRLTYNNSPSINAKIGVSSDGKLLLAPGGTEVSIDATSSLNVKGHNGSSLGLMLNNALVLATADQLNFNVVTAGAALPSRAMVLNSSGAISGISALSATSLTGTLQTAAQPNITSVNMLDITGHNGLAGLKLGGIQITATGTELNYVDVSTLGTAEASKALVLNSTRDIININNLAAANLTGTLMTAAQPNITSLGTLTGLNFNGALTGLKDLSINTTEVGRTLVLNHASGNTLRMFYDAATNTTKYADFLMTATGDLKMTTTGGNVDITTHDGISQGLKLGSVLVKASADQINYLEGTSPGRALPGKAVIMDANSNLSDISSLSATSLSGTLQTAAQPNISSVTNLNITAHDGSASGLKLNGTLVTATATELNYVDTTAGSAEASKALVLSSTKNISGIHTLSAEQLTGTLQTAAQPNVTSVGTLTSVAVAGDITIGSTELSEVDLAKIDGITDGAAASNKALVLNFDKGISGITSLSAIDLTGTIQTHAQPNIESVTTLNVTGHDGISAGLALDGTLVTSTATEINYTNTTPGTAEAIKALVVDANRDITNIHNLSALNLTGTLQTAAQPNVTSVGTLTSLSVAGDVTVGSTTLSEQEVGVLNAVTPGVVSPLKALVVDENKNISTLNTVGATTINAGAVNATTLAGTLQTAAQPNITSVTTLNITGHDGIAGGLSLGGTLLTATAEQINSIFGDGGEGTFNRLMVNDTLTLGGADGATKGLVLGEDLVTASGEELNYLDSATPGTVVAGKAVVVDDNKDIASFRNLTATNLTGTIQTAAQPNITSVGTLSTLEVAGDITVGDTILTEAEIAVLDAVVPGTADNSKALVLNATKDISGIHDLSATTLTSTGGSLTMGSTSISETDIAKVDGITNGTALPDKALVVDANKDISGIADLSAETLTSTAGSLTMGATSISEIDIAKVDGITNGTASADKALVVDEDKDISGINNLSATTLESTAGTLKMGATNVSETDIAKIDNIVNGEAAANKALVLNGDKDISGIADLSASTLTATSGSLTMGGTTITETEVGVLDTVTPGTVSPFKAVVVDGNKDISSFRNLTSVALTATGGTLTMGGTAIDETEIGYLNDTMPGAATPFKAMVLNNENKISGIAEIGTDSLVTDSLTVGGVTIDSSSIDVIDEVVHGEAAADKALVLNADKDISGIADLSAETLTATAGSLTMGGTTINESEIGVLDAVTPGIVTASKAVVVDANKDISSFRNLTAVNLTGTLQTADQPNVTSVGTLDSLSVAGDLTVGATTLTESELAVLDEVVPGVAGLEKALVLNSSGGISGISSLSSTNITGTLQTAAQPNVTSVNTLNITGHDGSANGLKLGGSLLSATAPELNYNDGATPGTVVSGKTVVAGDDSAIAGFSSVQSTKLVLSDDAAGSKAALLMGTYNVSSGEMGVLDGATPGHALPSKALIFDEDKNIDGINALTALQLTGEVQTASQPKITSVSTLDITSHDGATSGLSLGGVLLTATATQINSIFGEGGEGTFNRLTVNDTLTLANADGTSKGLVLGSTLVTSSGAELNYLDGSTPGIATSGNVVVLNSDSSISGINSLSATSLTGTLQTAAQPHVTSVGTLTSLAVSGDITVGGTQVAGTDLFKIDGITDGTAAAGKALVLNSTKDISDINSLSATTLIGTLQTAAQPNVTSVGTLTSLDVAGDAIIGGSLNVNGTIISENEIAVLDAATPGTAEAIKAMVTDSNNSIAGINSLSATTLTGTLQTAAQPKITSVGTLTSLDVAGDAVIGGTLNVNGTIISEAEIAVLDAATPGTAEADKAMVTDSNNSIGGINSLSATSLTGEIQTASQPKITSVSTLDITGHDGAAAGIKLGGVLVTSMASELNYVDTTIGHAQAIKALILDGDKNIDGINNISLNGLTSVTGSFTDATDSMSPSTGAIITAGGVGVAKNISVGGNASVVGSMGVAGLASVSNVTDSTNATSGAFTTAGGVGIAKSLYVGANSNVLGNMAVTGNSSTAGLVSSSNVTQSTSTTNGAIVTSGGVGVAKNINVGGNAAIAGTLAITGATTLTGDAAQTSSTQSTSTITGAITTAGGVGIAKNINVGGNAAVGGTLGVTGATSISNTTDSTSTSTGSLVTAGGAGVAKNLNVGSNTAIGGTLAVTGTSTLTGATSIASTLSVTGNATMGGNAVVTGDVTGASMIISGGLPTFTASLLTTPTAVPSIPSPVQGPFRYDTVTGKLLMNSINSGGGYRYLASNGTSVTTISVTSALNTSLMSTYSDVTTIGGLAFSPNGTLWCGLRLTNIGATSSYPALATGTLSGGITTLKIAFTANASVSGSGEVGSIECGSDTNIVIILKDGQSTRMYYTTDGSTFQPSTTQVAGLSAGTAFTRSSLRYMFGKYVCGTSSGLFYSTDGNAWTAVTGATGNRLRLYYNSTLNKAFSLSGNTLKTSTDGVTWVDVTFPTITGFTSGPALCSSFSELFAVYPDIGSTTQKIVYSLDGGSTWSTIDVPNKSKMPGFGYVNGPYDIADTPVNNCAYWIFVDSTTGFTLAKTDSLTFSTNLFKLGATSGYMSNQSSSGYKWLNGSTTSLAGSQLMQLDSTSLTLTSSEVISNATDSTSTTTGSFTTAGGAGIAKSLNVGGNVAVAGSLATTGPMTQNGSLTIVDTTESTTTATGSLKTAGGVGIAKNINVGGTAGITGALSVGGASTLTGSVIVSSTTESANTATGSITTAGGVGIAKSLNVGINATVVGALSVGGASTLTGAVAVANGTQSTSVSTGSLTTIGGAGVAKNLNVGGDVNIAGTLTTSGPMVQNGALSIRDTTDSSSITTGSITTAGGVGITKCVHVGGTVTVENESASTAKTTGALVVYGGMGVVSDVNVGGDLHIEGDDYIGGDLNLTGRFNTTNVNWVPDLNSPFSIDPLTNITTTELVLAINRDAGVGYLFGESKIIAVPNLVTTGSIAYYGVLSNTNSWSTLPMTGDALASYTANYSDCLISIRQLVTSPWSDQIWVVGSFYSSSNNKSIPIVLNGTTAAGFDTLYAIGTPSTTSSTLSGTTIAVATDDNNVAVTVYVSPVQTDLYYMDVSDEASAGFTLVQSGQFKTVAWLSGLGKFVATRSGTSATYTSTGIDGSVWVDGTTPSSIAPNTIYFNTTLNLAVAVGDRFIWYSTNGYVWSECTYPVLATSNKFTAVVNSSVSGLVAIYSNVGNTVPQIYYTTDIVNWTAQTIGSTFGYNLPLTSNVAYDSMHYAYAVGMTGSSTTIQKIGPITEASRVYRTLVTSGYMKSDAATGYQWFQNSTATVDGSKLMQLNPAALTVSPKMSVSNTTDSANVATGSIVTSGGVGIAKSLTVGSNAAVMGTFNVGGATTQTGILTISDATDAASAVTGAVKVAGGVGIAKSLFVGSNTQIAGSLTVTGATNLAGDFAITSATETTSSTTGALKVAGGVGIAKSLNVGLNANVAGNLSVVGTSAFTGVQTILDTTDSSSSTTGSFTTAGGVGISKKLYVGTDASVGGTLSVIGNSSIAGKTTISNSTDAASVSDASVMIAGGVGIAKKLIVGTNAAIGGSLSVATNADITGTVSIASVVGSSSAGTGALVIGGGVGVGANLNVGANANVVGALTVSGTGAIVDTTDAASSTTGSLTVAGGLGVAKKLYVGSGIYGTIMTTAQPNINSVSTLDITSHDGTQGLKLGGLLVTSDASELNLLDGAIAGSAVANKAMVLAADKSITGISSVTATSITGQIQTASQPLITSVSTLDITAHDGATSGLSLGGVLLTVGAAPINSLFAGTSNLTLVNETVTSNLTLSGHNGSSNGLILGSTLVTATGTELNYVDTTPGTAQASKALVTDANLDISSINSLTATKLTGQIQTASQPLITSVNVLDVASHNGSTVGLSLNGTLITATGAELNYVDTTPGTAEASKALVLNSNLDIAGIRAITAQQFIGTLQTAAQPNITSVGTLTSLSLAGNLTMGTTVISESDIIKIDAITNGTAAANKALVLNSTSDIAGIHQLSATTLAIGAPTNSIVMPMHVGTTAFTPSFAYAYANSDNAHGVINSGEAVEGLFSARFEGRIIVQGEVDVTSDRRLKENVSDLSLDIAKRFVKESRPVRFNWRGGDKIPELGWVAQEVYKAGFTDLVNVTPHPGLQEEIDDDGFVNPADAKFSIATGKIIPLLTLTIKDLTEQNEEKDAKIADLESRLDKLEAIIANMM